MSVNPVRDKILKDAKKLRGDNPTLSQALAVKQASANYREETGKEKRERKRGPGTGRAVEVRAAIRHLGVGLRGLEKKVKDTTVEPAVKELEELVSATQRSLARSSKKAGSRPSVSELIKANSYGKRKVKA